MLRVPGLDPVTPVYTPRMQPSTDEDPYDDEVERLERRLRELQARKDAKRIGKLVRRGVSEQIQVPRASQEVPGTDREVLSREVPRTDREVPGTVRGVETGRRVSDVVYEKKSDLRKKSDLSTGQSHLEMSHLADRSRISPVAFRTKCDSGEERRHEMRHQEKRLEANSPSRISPQASRIQQPNIAYQSVMTWEDALEGWIGEQASSKTRANFRYQGYKFLEWIKKREEGSIPVPGNLKPSHLNEYKNHLMGRELSQNSIHTHCMQIKSLCTWLYNEAVTVRNVGKKLKPPPYESPGVEAIEKAEIRSLFEVADDNQRLFLCFGFYLAIRVGALVSLKRKNITEIDEEKQTFRLTWIAKGNRRVSKVYTEWDSLPVGWISEMLVMADEEYLFKGRKEKDHIAVRTAQRWMKRLGKACDIQVGLEGESRITPHDLRHSGATIIAEASGGNQFALKDHLHHKNIGMSQHYVHATKKTVADRENMLRFSNEQDTYQHVAWCNKTCGNACNGEQYAHKPYCNGLCNNTC